MKLSERVFLFRVKKQFDAGRIWKTYWTCQRKCIKD